VFCKAYQLQRIALGLWKQHPQNLKIAAASTIQCSKICFYSKEVRTSEPAWAADVSKGWSAAAISSFWVII